MRRNFSSAPMSSGIKGEFGWMVRGLATLWAFAGVCSPNSTISVIVVSMMDVRKLRFVESILMGVLYT